MKYRDDIVAYANAPRLEIVGDSQCVVDGLRGILEYTKDRIKIDLGKYAVLFIGSDLYINALSHEGAVVEGTLISMEFCSHD